MRGRLPVLDRRTGEISTENALPMHETQAGVRWLDQIVVGDAGQDVPPVGQDIGYCGTAAAFSTIRTCAAGKVRLVS